MSDGGPAFPNACTDQGHAGNVPPGMSLLDYFAAHETSTPPDSWMEVHYRSAGLESSGVVKREALVKWRYEMAGSMVYASQQLKL
jgi:hypothetical protein